MKKDMEKLTKYFFYRSSPGKLQKNCFFDCLFSRTGRLRMDQGFKKRTIQILKWFSVNKIGLGDNSRYRLFFKKSNQPTCSIRGPLSKSVKEEQIYSIEGATDWCAVRGLEIFFGKLPAVTEFFRRVLETGQHGLRWKLQLDPYSIWMNDYLCSVAVYAYILFQCYTVNLFATRWNTYVEYKQ